MAFPQRDTLAHTEPDNLSLYHHGVKGMRWGVRRKASFRSLSSAEAKKGPRENESEDHKVAQSLKKKSTASLSNQDLKRINERLQLEQNYANLTKKPGKLLSGQQKVQRILSVGGQAQTAYNLVTSPMAKSIGRGILKGASKLGKGN